ncbi:hypothetical protein QAD02_020797 [Eretmocerus hayati]|uniref:Uncharacterized protein n=1 Tax=Eretmocerus hayati TaxID=131215 RepID=A0ACC2PNW5_9HYME|nr:hypothetical protein QAD02_020797 [Eretmocerus hayati]
MEPKLLQLKALEKLDNSETLFTNVNEGCEAQVASSNQSPTPASENLSHTIRKSCTGRAIVKPRRYVHSKLLQVRTSGKRKEEERLPGNKVVTVVKRKFIEQTKKERNTGSEELKHTEQEQPQENQQKDMIDMEELRQTIGSMHEDMKNMEGKMMGRMDTLLKELKTENERRAEELDK